jgi:hypothetical protein
MRSLLATSLAGLLMLTGCNRESERGGPGATSNPAAKSGQPAPNTEAVKEARQDLREAKQEARQEARENQTFTLEVPKTTDVSRGKRQEVTVTLNRGENFDQMVKLQFKAPPGLKVVPDQAAIQKGESGSKVLIEAAADAAAGEQAIEVIGTPETGAAVTVRMPVEVQERD